MTIEDGLSKLTAEINQIKERNHRVEADKAWEKSFFRISTIALITYFIAALFLYLSDVQNYLTSSLVPVIGYLLSVQSLPIIKKWWVKKYF